MRVRKDFYGVGYNKPIFLHFCPFPDVVVVVVTFVEVDGGTRGSTRSKQINTTADGRTAVVSARTQGDETHPSRAHLSRWVVPAGRYSPSPPSPKHYAALVCVERLIDRMPLVQATDCRTAPHIMAVYATPRWTLLRVLYPSYV